MKTLRAWESRAALNSLVSKELMAPPRLYFVGSGNAIAVTIALEMMRRAEEADNGAKSCKIATAAGINKSRLAEAAAVLDYSIDSDLVQDVLSGDKGLQAAAEIEALAKRRLADEYDAAQERGEVQSQGGDRTKLPEEKFAPATANTMVVGLPKRKAKHPPPPTSGSRTKRSTKPARSATPSARLARSASARNAAPVSC